MLTDSPYYTIIQLAELGMIKGKKPVESIQETVELFKKQDLKNPHLAERLQEVLDFAKETAEKFSSPAIQLHQLKFKFIFNWKR